MILDFANFLLSMIDSAGYFGIFILMSIESSFIPFPSEVVLIPAGYLIAGSQLNGYLVFFLATSGSVLGALINYVLALSLGRKFLLRYGKYVLIKPDELHRAEKFFYRHAVVATFSGRLVPVLRQLISIPAGISRMPLVKFVLLTALGAGIWNLILIIFGLMIAKNRELLSIYLPLLTYLVLGLGILVIIMYYVYNRVWGDK